MRDEFAEFYVAVEELVNELDGTEVLCWCRAQN
jgi:hypothetical protein